MCGRCGEDEVQAMGNVLMRLVAGRSTSRTGTMTTPASVRKTPLGFRLRWRVSTLRLQEAFLCSSVSSGHRPSGDGDAS